MQRIARTRDYNSFAILCTFTHAHLHADAYGIGTVNEKLINMLIEKFIEYLQIEKKYSVNTLHAYKKDLAEFQEFIYENYDKYVI